MYYDISVEGSAEGN
jgi:hypothetical protein